MDRAAKDPRWVKPYTALTYQPMKEVLAYLRANGFKTYIVTGGGQDFVRVYSEATYGIPPEQVVGTRRQHDVQLWQGRQADPDQGTQAPAERQRCRQAGGHPSDDRAPAGFRGFGNSTGDKQMLEYTEAGDGPRLGMLVLHDDAEREYAYGPATGLPDTKVGAFTQELYDEAMKNGWMVISMKKDWKRIFAFGD